MVTLTKPAYYNAYRYAEYDGLSTDDKSTIDAYNGDKFYEIDTSKTYRYNETSKEWIEQPTQTTAIDTGLPPITTESAGHFLSNDGSVTHWQELASADFIIHLTDNDDDTYTADKTYVEIKAAYDGKENIAVQVDNARLPLMNAQFSNDDAGFTFGYTQVTTDGQVVSTRAIHYLHIANADDEWTDADQSGEYIKTSGGTMTGDLDMGGHTIANVAAPTNENHVITLGYLTQNMKDDTATKNHVSLVRSSGATFSLQNGVYLLTACDTVHRGLTCVYMCGDTTTVYDLSGMAGWSVTKGAVANSIYINNKSDVQGLDVYINAIGASPAI